MVGRRRGIELVAELGGVGLRDEVVGWETRCLAVDVASSSLLSSGVSKPTVSSWALTWRSLAVDVVVDVGRGLRILWYRSGCRRGVEWLSMSAMSAAMCGRSRGRSIPPMLGPSQWAGGTGEVDDGGGRKKDVTWVTWQITVARNGQSRADGPAKYIY